MLFQLKRPAINLKPEHIQLYLTHVAPILDYYVGELDTRRNREVIFAAIKIKLRKLGYPRKPKIKSITINTTIKSEG